ncbi:MAG TPA: sulfatase-like hydrolase/transferase [Bacillota bacterium]|nr:sulfatase-like hydrolase/transferase [Bacillota bacterium]
MNRTFKGSLLVGYFILSITFMETIFHVNIYKDFTLQHLGISLLFMSVIGIAMAVIVLFFKDRSAWVVSIVLLGFISIVYISQMIYYAFFKTFYSLYSVGKGLTVTQFWKDILQTVGANIVWVLLFLLPVIILALFGKGYFSFRRGNLFTIGIYVFMAVVLQLSAIGLIHVSERGQHSAYELYFDQHFPLQATEKLGLLTSVRLDVQRTLTNWSPTLSTPPKLTEAASPVDGDKDASATEESEEEEIKYQTMDIDFDALIEEASDEEFKELHTYFSNKEPTEENDMTGKYEGYNLILLTAEGFSPFAVDEEITPTLYKLVHEGYHFPNFYTPIWEVSTSDGEYVALNSLIPKNGVWSFEQSAKNDFPFALGNQLSEQGYVTKAYHNHTYTYYGRDQSHPNLGYDYKGLGNGLDVTESWPESDLEMMEKTVDAYIDEEPFHIYYMTVSGHMQYSFEGNEMAFKNRDVVADAPYSDQAKAYLATQVELDRALEYLLDRLEEKGVLDETIIALSGDHYPYGLDDETMNEFAGHPVEQNFELYENDFILYTEDMDPKVNEKYGSSFDILPTLSNMLGLEYDSRLMIGKDLFSEADPLIPFLNKSFITDKGMYNSESKEFIPHEGEQPVDDAYIEEMIARVEAQFYFSTKVLEKDYYRHVFE